MHIATTLGCLQSSEIKAIELAKEYNDLELAAIISTDISTDGTLEGPNIKALREIAGVSKNPIIASGGIGSIADLLSLISYEKEGIEGIIVGRALYDGSIDLKEAITSIDNRMIQDSFLRKDEYVV